MFKFSMEEQVVSFNGFDFKYILKNRKYDTNHLIVVFSGFGGNSQFTYDFRKALISSRAYVLWIKDDFYNNNNATYYFDPLPNNSNILEDSIYQFIQKCRLFLNIKSENCTLLGCSKGGAAALYYGLKYNFKNILISAPPLRVGSSVAGIIPKSAMKKPAIFMLGENFGMDQIEVMDNKILDVLKEDINYDKNIFLISSDGDPRFDGQIKPYLYLFNKYLNFNFIQSASVLVRSHPDVTSYNAPLILGLLSCFAFNLIPNCKNSIIKGDDIDVEYSFDNEAVFKLSRVDFNENGKLYLEGIYFIRGFECAEYSDLQYYLCFWDINTDNEIYKMPLAKANKPEITKEYYKGKYINYDKAYFCTKGHQGLNMELVPHGHYLLKIMIELKNGNKHLKTMKASEKIDISFKNNELIQFLEADENRRLIYTKK